RMVGITVDVKSDVLAHGALPHSECERFAPRIGMVTLRGGGRDPRARSHVLDDGHSRAYDQARDDCPKHAIAQAVRHLDPPRPDGLRRRKWPVNESPEPCPNSDPDERHGEFGKCHRATSLAMLDAPFLQLASFIALSPRFIPAFVMPRRRTSRRRNKGF